MSKKKIELLLGCGHSRQKRMGPPNEPLTWGELWTLDINTACKPDIVCDLTKPDHLERISVEYQQEFDAIHAYEVLEHCGAQGDVALLFAQFAAFWLMLKPDGLFYATVPAWNSIWAWGDPSHTRIISAATLVFLDRDEYEKQLGKTPMSDYRSLLGGISFRCLEMDQQRDTFAFVLQKV